MMGAAPLVKLLATVHIAVPSERTRQYSGVKPGFVSFQQPPLAVSTTQPLVVQIQSPHDDAENETPPSVGTIQKSSLRLPDSFCDVMPPCHAHTPLKSDAYTRPWSVCAPPSWLMVP